MRPFAFVLALCLASILSDAQAQQVLRLSGFEAENLTPIAQRVLSGAYARLGIQIEVVITHPRRGLLLSSSGMTDGELVRVRSAGEKHSSLLRVDVPIVTSRVFAYANREDLKGKRPEELAFLRAAHLDGALFPLSLATQFSEVWEVRTPEQLFDMLRRGRVDVVIVSEKTGNQMIDQLGLEGVFALQPTLTEITYYHYLHKRHAKLIPRIEAALKKSSFRQRIWKTRA